MQESCLNCYDKLSAPSKEEGTLDPVSSEHEIQSLACEISRAFCRQIEVQVSLLDKTVEECLADNEKFLEQKAQQALHGDPSQFTWMDFRALSKRDPEIGLQRWNEVKEAARKELLSGHRVARTSDVTLTSNAWQRAQYLAIRDGLAQEWNPQNGIERSLIDMMAQAFSTQLFWQERMMCYSCLELDTEQIKRDSMFQPPRVSDSQAVDQAAQMVDRFNRIFMRSLRALRDLRRHAPTLVVHNAQHVNVAQNQLNVDGK